MPKEPTRLPRPELDLDPDHPHVADWFHYADLLTDAERADLRRVREFLRAEVAPVVLDAWDRAEFPMQLVKGFAGLDLAGAGYADPPASRLFLGFLHAEISRVDPSVNSFYGVHTGLAMGSIHAGGTPEQRRRWLPAMARMDSIGAFGLTEPHGGSDVAGGMETTATRDGSGPDAEWILDGEKRWIGNATFADLIIVWARDTDQDADGAVRGFVVPSPSDGMTITKIEGKQSLRIVQNADILLDQVRVPESHRLSGGSGTFRDAGLVLQRTRANAAWGAVGVQMAAYELALSYAAQREQFGRPIGRFQLMQDLLVRMLGNVSASLGMAVRNAQLLDQGRGSDAHSSLVKEFCATRMRETVAMGRQLVGGNGVVLENRIAKYFADAEAMFSFEGTREMNTLIVGKAVTGQSAFVR